MEIARVFEKQTKWPKKPEKLVSKIDGQLESERRRQKKWAKSGKGRLPFSVCSRKKERKCSPKMCNLLTEYELFKAYLRKLNLKKVDAVCDYEEENGTLSIV